MATRISALLRRTTPEAPGTHTTPLWSYRPQSDREAGDAIVSNFALHWFPAKVSKAAMSWSYSFWLGTISAALFLLHDAHEWILGDIVTPAVQLFAARAGTTALLDAIAACRAGWDDAIYQAAGLPLPALWTDRQRKVVKAMDNRMLVAEAVALFGENASKKFPPWGRPKTTGAIVPWSSERAEREFKKLLHLLIDEQKILDQANVALLSRLAR